jgi:HK97 family phage prohead protease
MSSKAFSTFEIKSFDEEKRRIVGIASTPAPDRDGDEVMPKGATFTLPFPLLHQHDAERPIGNVTKATVTDAGIEIEADIPKDTGLGYIETAYRQIKAGLLRGLSIGFRATKSEPTRTGRKFLSYEIFELSAVTIPANAQAGITTVKQYDAEPVDVEEHLFTIESHRKDVFNRAVAAITQANQNLNKGN